MAELIKAGLAAIMMVIAGLTFLYLAFFMAGSILFSAAKWSADACDEHWYVESVVDADWLCP